MGGSLLSKFRRRHRKIAPLTDNSDPKYKQSRSSMTTKNAFEEQAVVAEKPSLEKVPLEKLKHDTLADSASANTALKPCPSVLKAQVLQDFEEIVRQAKKEARVLESAREILAAQSSVVSSWTSTSHAAVDTHTVSLGDTPGSTAFEILLGERRTVCAAARMPRRLRRLEKPPQLTAEEIAEKMKAVEKKRVEALERTRATAQVKKRKHPADVLSRNTAEKISVKMSKADAKRSEVIERKKEAGQKASRAMKKIADAQVYAREQIKNSVEEKKKKFEMKQAEYAALTAEKKRKREQHAQRVQEKARYMVPEEESDAPMGLELEADELYCASDSDESWDTERVSLWKDFGV